MYLELKTTGKELLLADIQLGEVVNIAVMLGIFCNLSFRDRKLGDRTPNVE